MDFLAKILDFIECNPGLSFIFSASVIQLSPIKINPWTFIFGKIGSWIIGDLKKDLLELKRDFEETKAQDKRWHILNFADSCRRNERHTKEEWEHAIAELAEYENYTERKGITNGVIEETAKYLRGLYHERIIKNDFL